MNEIVKQEANPFKQNMSTEVVPSALSNDAVRAMQEVQGAIISAKKFPRNRFEAYNCIMQDCDRLGLAEKALYSYPRAGQTVSGPSIRLAEVLAQNWGNLDYGIRELEQRDGESLMEAYCWDLETNVRQTKTFVVKHERSKKDKRDSSGKTKIIEILEDPRDIYEMNANMGARRLRACILGIIPGDITEKAVEACRSTLKKGDGQPLTDRLAKLFKAFQGMGVTLDMIEERLGHSLDAIDHAEFVSLYEVYTSIKDKVADRSQFFNLGATDEKIAEKKSDDLNAKFLKKS